MSGHQGQQATFPLRLPDDYRKTGLPRTFDSRSRIAKNIAQRRAAFARDPAQLLEADLEQAYHGLTLWRQDKEGKLRVRRSSLDADKTYLALTNAWLGTYKRVVALFLTGHSQDPEQRLRDAFATTPADEGEDAP